MTTVTIILALACAIAASAAEDQSQLKSALLHMCGLLCFLAAALLILSDS